MSQTRRLLLEFETEEAGKLAAENARNRNALIKAFSDTSDVVRERALLAAIELADPNIVTDVIPSMEDDDNDVRIACAQVLAWYHQPRTIPQMIKGLTDSNTWVRSHCAAGLSKLLHGPIWARLPEESIDLFINGFPDLSEAQIREFLFGLKMLPESIDSYMKWREEDFNIEIDESILIEELEKGPIILVETDEDVSRIEEYPLPSVSMKPSLPEDIEVILSELPEEVRLSLPPEDLVRLTPDSARELVDTLKEPAKEKKKEKKPKKKVKVRKVKKVRKVSEGPSKSELIKKIPKDVRESVGEETLKTLKTEELLALIGPEEGVAEEIPEVKEEPEEPTEIEKEKEEEKKKKEAKTPSEEIELMTQGPSEEDIETRLKTLTDKFGSEKAQLLINIPENVLAGIPEEQIHEMDMETLQGLTEALESQ